MTLILKPFTLIMNRLKYFQKFILIFLLFFIPIIGSLALIIYNIDNDIEFSQKQKIGLEANLTLQELVQNLQQHRGLSAGYLGGNESMKEKMIGKQNEIAETVLAFDQYLQTNSPITIHNDEWLAIKKQWDQLKQTVEGLKATESFSRHTDLIRSVLLLTSSISDSTNLSLDSDMVRDHLTRIITDDLIYSTEYMGQARAIGSNILATKTLLAEQEANLTHLSRSMNESLKNAEESMNILLEKNEDARETLSKRYEESLKASKNFAQLTKNEIFETQQFTYDSSTYFEEATKAIDTIYKNIDASALVLDKLISIEIKKLSFQKNVVILTNIIAIILAIILFIAFYKSVKESIESINASTAIISSGDLTERIQLKTKDETKQIQFSINSMMDSIQQLIKANQTLSEELSASAEELSSSSEECAHASERISEMTQTVAVGSDQQMSSVKEANEAIQLMSLHIDEVASNSDEMQKMFEQTAHSTEKGVQIVKRVVTSMNDIYSTVQTSAGTIKNLGDSSQKIGDIISLITDIANQTNLLALNAAIEAARAGEHGKGFAVVAEEVRKLAEQSNHSAGQVSSLIADIQKETINAVQSMEQGTEKVNIGLSMANQVNDVFENINSEIQNVTHKVKTVANAVEKISNQSNDMNQVMENVKKTAEDSASASQESSAASEQQLATMEEISASATSLSNMAEELQALIKKFIV